MPNILRTPMNDGMQPQWLTDMEDAVRDAAAYGWVITEPIEFHWQGAEEATWTLDPEDL